MDSKSKLREILKRNDAALDLLDRMSTLNQSSFGLTYAHGLDMDIPNLYLFLQARKLLGCKWRMDLGEGNVVEVLRTAASLEHMAAALVHEPLLISTLVGHVAEKEYHELIHQFLTKADETTLSIFDVQLRHLRSMAVPIRTVLAAEGAMTYWSLAQSGSSALYTNSEETGSALRRWTLVDRRLVMAASVEVYADLVQNSTAPITTRKGEVWPSRFNVGPQNVWREMLLETANSAIERHQATESARILAGLAVDLCRKSWAVGTYPLNLSEFRAEPSPYTGEHVKYELHEDGSATLSFPKADRFWESRNKDEPPAKPRFVWNLPPRGQR